MRTLACIVLASLASVGCGASASDDPSSAVVASIVQPSPPFYGDPANHAVFAVDISQWEGPMSQREMDCFWDSGVRHVVAGTQVADVTRQQLAMAASRGMTVDAYVYLYWTTDMKAQVDTAFQRASGFPIGRMWLDIEQGAGGLGASEIVSRIQSALDECRAHGGVECGFYTGSGFWDGATSDSKSFADVPLWYAIYDNRTSLADWPTESFGAWTRPVAKQFNKVPLCGVGLDRDVMQVLGQPSVVVDRSPNRIRTRRRPRRAASIRTTEAT